MGGAKRSRTVLRGKKTLRGEKRMFVRNMLKKKYSKGRALTMRASKEEVLWEAIEGVVKERSTVNLAGIRRYYDLRHWRKKDLGKEKKKEHDPSSGGKTEGGGSSSNLLQQKGASLLNRKRWRQFQKKKKLS